MHTFEDTDNGLYPKTEKVDVLLSQSVLPETPGILLRDGLVCSGELPSYVLGDPTMVSYSPPLHLVVLQVRPPLFYRYGTRDLSVGTSGR